MRGYYSDVKTVCTYPQGYCCRKASCRLYNRCSVLPKGQNLDVRKFLLTRVEPESEAERSYHKIMYKHYNRKFGDLNNRDREYRHKNWDYVLRYNRERWRKAHPPKEFVSVLYKSICDLDCINCPYDDCELPVWTNSKEYHRLYYRINREKKLEYAKSYYQSHKNIKR